MSFVRATFAPLNDVYHSWLNQLDRRDEAQRALIEDGGKGFGIWMAVKTFSCVS